MRTEERGLTEREPKEKAHEKGGSKPLRAELQQCTLGGNPHNFRRTCGWRCFEIEQEGRCQKSEVRGGFQCWKAIQKAWTQKTPTIAFNDTDREGVIYPQDDALVVTMLVANYTSWRILVTPVLVIGFFIKYF